IVMPRSRSWSMESMTRSVSAAPSRKAPDWRSMASTSVVLPWSTWAMMATLRRSARVAEKVGLTAGMRRERLGGLPRDGGPLTRPPVEEGRKCPRDGRHDDDRVDLQGDVQELAAGGQRVGELRRDREQLGGRPEQRVP